MQKKQQGPRGCIAKQQKRGLRILLLGRRRGIIVG
ncbi:hypothetical protein DVU_0860 [Nitratidesulfovibrio vulgaris str. Hildenborough]|uniref:Uncharacterized protein n=1 Tax=Nitratidesulfovibrio vulgaris (strain ATCC 29579 / DSM 644 / CCUG 34227 / NCIMB 8303 / VKM B-1760 / Hildenborough) TaxID=882 RepID=Q72DR9_NITV2|nr:hypothetical protein DVU_0860 [Nitratidesulfovibrio vulgaris str. Hildenborough]